MVEIAFDVIHRSSRHASGFALRFPRIVRIRDDKDAAEVDRLSTVAALHDAARRRVAATASSPAGRSASRPMSDDGAHATSMLGLPRRVATHRRGRAMTETPCRRSTASAPCARSLTATGAGIYLATHVAGPLPAETLAAVHESDELELRIGRVRPDRAEDLAQREREARAVRGGGPQGAPRARSC